MEKQSKYQDKILKFLPKAVSVVTFHQNLPFSPNRDVHNKRFSGPINIPMIPLEARIRRPKSFNHRDDDDRNDQEPTSPKISCMGQIKHNKNKRANSKGKKKVTCSPRDQGKKKQHQISAFKRMLSLTNTIKPGRKSSETAGNSASVDDHSYDVISRPHSLPDKAPVLSQMKRFASGRESMAGFDWASAVQVAPVDPHHYSDHDFDDDDDDDDDDVKIPYSAPMAIGSGSGDNEVPLKPRKEINLWKRRTMTPPRPILI